MALAFRKYEPGDEVAILELFRQSYGRPMKLEYWQWRFLDNPFGGPMIELAWDGATLAAHYAVSPVVMDVDGQPLLTALSGTTMTHPEHRGQGLFPKLAETLYDRLRRSGCFMVWGFPNDQSHRGIVRDLRWQDVYEIPMLRLEVRDVRAQVSDNISEFVGFDPAFDDLWPKARFRSRIAVRHDRRFLSWRLHAGSGNSYRCVGCRVKGEWLGYAAYKVYGEEMDLVDLLIAHGTNADAELLAALLAVCAREGLKAINSWVPVGDPTHALFEKNGFRNWIPVTYFGARRLAESRTDVSDVRGWRYSMIDSDVF